MLNLVTGAGGFVGSALCASLLADGQEVIGILRPGEVTWRMSDKSLVGLKTEQHDITDPNFSSVIERLRPARIFHLAAHGAYSWQNDAAAIVTANLTATIQLADAAAKAGCEAFVHTGSSSEYGLKDVPHNEDDRIMPNSVYAASKAAATLYLGHLARTKVLPAVTARLFSIYGPFEDRSRLIPQVVLQGRSGGIPPLASPTIARDFVYVDDAVQCLRTLSDSLASEPFPSEVVNICSGIETTLADVAAASAGVFDLKVGPVWGTYEARGWDTNKWSGNPSLASGALGFQATTNVAEGLRRFSDWIGENANRLSYYGN
jgi:UDP-glucose 4-epimerase